MTNVRSQCNEEGDKVYTNVTFDVLARRTDTAGARQVTVPYFVTVLRGGRAVVTKRVGQVTIQFAPGQERAQASGQGSPMSTRPKRLCPPKSGSGSPASARLVKRTRQSIRCRSRT